MTYDNSRNSSIQKVPTISGFDHITEAKTAFAKELYGIQAGPIHLQVRITCKPACLFLGSAKRKYNFINTFQICKALCYAPSSVLSKSIALRLIDRKQQPLNFT
jgi:hypothetical protein